MGKIGKFFKKVWGGVKKGATKVWDVGKKVVEKAGHVLRPAADIAEKAGKFMSILPGKFGKFGQALDGGGRAIKTMTDMLPDSQAKTKLNEYIDNGINKGHSAIDRGKSILNDVNNKTQPWIRSGVDITRHIAKAYPK